MAQRPRGPARATVGPERTPALNLQWGRYSRVENATSSRPQLPKPDNPSHSRAPHAGTAFRGATAAGPVPRCSTASPVLLGALCAPRLSPGPSKAVTKPSLPARFPSLARSGATQTRPRWVSEENPTALGGSAAPRPPRCSAVPLAPGKDPGQQRSASSPGLGSAHSERKTSQQKRSRDPCLARAPRRELF